jgi:hypothetical protein
MSQTEDPALTLIRLLQRNMHVVKDDGSLANVQVSREWCDRELLKNCDGQVTVGLERSEENKLSFDGDIRRRLAFARVNVWVVDKPEQGVVGRNVRNRICLEVLRIIREKRTKPNSVNYNYVGVGCLSETHKAYDAASATEPSPTDSVWIELSDVDYQKIWYSDDTRHTKSVLENGKQAFMLFRFKIDAQSQVLKELVLKFEGYGVASAGNGITIKAWNFATGSWQNAVSGTAETDELLEISLTANLSDFIDENGFAYLLAKTTNPSDGISPAVLYCDYAEAAFTVNGITYADIVGSREADEVRVKPFLWRTEFTIKTWQFETVPVT